MTKIKICGITTNEELEFLNILQPDYIGFVFSNSKRKVTIEQSRKLSSFADKHIAKVGVFVNETIEYVMEAAEAAALDIIQLHGDETQAYMDKLKGIKLWKAFGIESYEDIKRVQDYEVQGIVFDSIVNGRSGGTGKTFDWNMLKEFKRNSQLILAGGLNKSNVKDAIKAAQPDIVDVSGGVEKHGIKDFIMCKDFISEVRKI